MNISESKFYHYVPSATNPEGSGIFEMVQDDLTVTKNFVASLLGSTLYEKVVAAQDDELSPLDHLCREVERYICLAAFDRAIPNLDLVLTPTGFGVVSNANVAPASADRVNRLMRQVRDLKECAFDTMLDFLRGNEDWCESDQAKKYFRSLVWAGLQMKNFGFPYEYRTKLEELRPSIAEAELSLSKIISPEFHTELTAAVRTKDRLSVKCIAIDLCLSYIYAFVSGYNYAIEHCKGAIIQYLDNYIDSFPTYAASSAYRANHFTPYENGQKDSCFFFG